MAHPSNYRGNDLDAIYDAISQAQQETDVTRTIKTIIGFGSPHKENTFRVHGSPLGEEEVKLTKQQLNWPEEPLFYIPKEVSEHFAKVAATGEQEENLANAI